MAPKLIAIAGGTGTIGQSIVSALLSNSHPHSHSHAKKYTPIILSRATAQNPDGTRKLEPAKSPSGKAFEIETRYVTYTSLESLVTALRDINTLISTLLIPDPSWVTIQLNLLYASIQSGVQRFAPSEFALSQEAHELVDVDEGKIIVWQEVKKAVTEGEIDAAAFPVGMFMNYLGIGIPDADVEREARAGFREGALMFYLNPNPQGAGGGGGGQPWIDMPLTENGVYPTLTMTDIRDIGKFVVAALGLEEWGGRGLGIAGDTVNLKDVVEVLQGRFGGRIVENKLSLVDLQKKHDKFPEQDILGRMDVQYTIACGRGACVVDGVLNRLCPEVRPTTVREFVERYWPVLSDDDLGD
ncbi:uncharacterized protein BDV17DRAFT_285631 [Aspergillus undulatus]|uniref:uncharacterized protein n=1 Tax=Aspergillus undulatus TaxID=1810928 RepID=UPI003CCDD08A